MAAPVVPCGCCVVGLAPARTAAVWMSVWAAGITGKPFTPAPSAVCSPSPSTLVLSAPSFLFLCFFFTPPVVYARTASSFALLACLSFSVCHQPSLFAFQLAQKNKHKLQQLEAVIVLLWNLIAFSMKGEVVNSELHVTVKSLQ